MATQDTGPRIVAITILGRVAGKGRPRATVRGGFVKMYTPAKTASHEANVALFAAMAMKGLPLLVGPLRLRVNVFQQYPKSWTRKQCAAVRYVTGKPDPDNVLKLIADALNGVVYRDDSQLAALSIDRTYRTDMHECVQVFISELDGP